MLLQGRLPLTGPLTRFLHRPKWPELAKSRHYYRPLRAGGGAVAQLGERRNRTAEVRGSNPLGSTSLRSLRELRLGKPRGSLRALRKPPRSEPPGMFHAPAAS